MDQAAADYTTALATLEREIVTFLKTFETIQENLMLGEVEASQAQMVAAVGDTFRRFDSAFVPLTPPADKQDLHERLSAAMEELGKSCNLFMTKPGQQWTLAFLYSRRAYCRALYLLYGLRDQLPLVNQYFLLANPLHDGGTPSEPPTVVAGSAPTGFTHHERNDERSRYTAYVPENYTPEKQWPLIVCLHGGYGDGFDYIWTWLRPARTLGYLLLAPKSLGDTWDMTIRSSDTRSVVKMIEEVTSQYNVDRSRVYLTGLSDGGIFTYIMGLERHDLFAALAPIAGALHMAADPLLRAGRGKDVPLFVVHGVHDFIFPVSFTRQTNQLLKEIGYNLKYEELPDWGHAFTYSINERLVLPWFESLPPKAI